MIETDLTTMENLCRGHEIKRVEGVSYYVDDDSPTEYAKAGRRDYCGLCGFFDTPEGHDGCIGTLPDPDVMNACCGHGNISCAYVQFCNSPSIAGEEALEYIKKHGEK